MACNVKCLTNLVEVVATPFGSMFTGMTIEHSKETLAANRVKVDDKRMSILHRAAGALVFRYTDLERLILGCMTIQDLSEWYNRDDL